MILHCDKVVIFTAVTFETRVIRAALSLHPLQYLHNVPPSPGIPREGGGEGKPGPDGRQQLGPISGSGGLELGVSEGEPRVPNRYAVRSRSPGIHTVGIRAGRLPIFSSIAYADVILLCGVAGGLDPALKIGDVVIDDPAGLLPQGLHANRGSIFTAQELVTTPDQKRAIHEKTHALAVDMEQSIVRTYAQMNNIPLISVRGISDTAGHAVNPAVMRFVDEVGNLRPARLSIELIKNPSLIRQLLQLNTNTRAALGSVVKVLQEILA